MSSDPNTTSTDPSSSYPGHAKTWRDYLTARNIKIALWLLAAVLAVMLFTFNWQPNVEIDLIVVKTKPVPLIILLLVMLAIGFVLGLVTPGIIKRRRRNK